MHFFSATRGVSRWGGKWHRLIDSLFQLAALTDKQGDIFCGRIRKLTIAPQEMRAVSNGRTKDKESLCGAERTGEDE